MSDAQMNWSNLLRSPTTPFPSPAEISVEYEDGKIEHFPAAAITDASIASMRERRVRRWWFTTQEHPTATAAAQG